MQDFLSDLSTSVMKTNANKFGRWDFILLALILTVALLFRLYKIDIPFGDLHSWRQADTAAVARNFVNNGFNLLKPTYDDLTSNQSGLENPQGLRLVEFPLYNATFAALYKYFPITSLEIYGRLVTIFFSLILIATLYFLLFKETGRLAASIGSFVYAAFPFFVFFSRVVLPHTTALACTFLSLTFLYLFSYEKNKFKNVIQLSLAIIFFAAALLITPYSIFYFLPTAYLFIKKYKWSIYKKLPVYLFYILTITPLFIWRNYISQFPEGVPVNFWFMTWVNTSEGIKYIFLRPAFFRWIFYERINNLILGGYLTVFFVLGIVAKSKKYFFLSILIASLAFLFTFEGVNVQHVYYQTLILPAVAIFIGLGVDFVYKNNKYFINPLLMILASLAIFGFSFFISYYQVRNYYNYSKDLISIANIVRDLTKKDDKIVTDTIGDTTLLYLSQRRGAPSVYKDFVELQKDGYKYFVTLKKEVVNDLKSKEQFELVFENEKFAIFKL